MFSTGFVLFVLPVLILGLAVGLYLLTREREE